MTIVNLDFDAGIVARPLERHGIVPQQYRAFRDALQFLPGLRLAQVPRDLIFLIRAAIQAREQRLDAAENTLGDLDRRCTALEEYDQANPPGRYELSSSLRTSALNIALLGLVFFFLLLL